MRGEKRAIAFRICTDLKKVYVHPGKLYKGEVIIALACRIMLKTYEGKEAFCRDAKDASNELLGREVPDWIIEMVWTEFINCEGSTEKEKFIPVPPSVAA